MKQQIPCPLCKDKFGSEVALRFHIKKAHPGAVEATRPLLRQIRANFRRAPEDDPMKLHPRLEALYSGPGCPCGRSARQHLADRKKQAGVGS